MLTEHLDVLPKFSNTWNINSMPTTQIACSHGLNVYMNRSNGGWNDVVHLKIQVNEEQRSRKTYRKGGSSVNP